MLKVDRSNGLLRRPRETSAVPSKLATTPLVNGVRRVVGVAVAAVSGDVAVAAVAAVAAGEGTPALRAHGLETGSSTSRTVQSVVGGAVAVSAVAAVAVGAAGAAVGSAVCQRVAAAAAGGGGGDFVTSASRADAVHVVGP